MEFPHITIENTKAVDGVQVNITGLCVTVEVGRLSLVVQAHGLRNREK